MSVGLMSVGLMSVGLMSVGLMSVSPIKQRHEELAISKNYGIVI